MSSLLTRRTFLAGASLVGAASLGEHRAAAGDTDYPAVDYHVHLSATITLERALELSAERGVKFGIVEHAGTRANKYPGLLSSDDDLKAYIAQLEGKPVLKGIQAEGLDWMTCFSREMVASLDYVLSDALTLPQRDGTRAEIWRPWMRVGDKQEFMDRYTDFMVRVIEAEPIDILANPSYLPDCIAESYDVLWTDRRMMRVVEAAARHRVALEINSRYRIPSLTFLRLAKGAGVKFSFGSNIQGADVGRIEFCIETARRLGLRTTDLFSPAPKGRKPIETRSFRVAPL
jgi:histidinol phosphatase-like PHP family hydrolase